MFPSEVGKVLPVVVVPVAVVPVVGVLVPELVLATGVVDPELVLACGKIPVVGCNKRGTGWLPAQLEGWQSLDTGTVCTADSNPGAESTSGRKVVAASPNVVEREM